MIPAATCLSPEGASLDSPGQRPGNPVSVIAASPNGAQHRTDGAVVAPFQGFGVLACSSSQGLRPGLSSDAPSGLSLRGAPVRDRLAPVRDRLTRRTA